MRALLFVCLILSSSSALASNPPSEGQLVDAARALTTPRMTSQLRASVTAYQLQSRMVNTLGFVVEAPVPLTRHALNYEAARKTTSL